MKIIENSIKRVQEKMEVFNHDFKNFKKMVFSLMLTETVSLRTNPKKSV